MRTFNLLLMICLLLITNGCGYKEVDNRFFSTSMGIDQSEKSEDYLKVTLKLAIPQSEIKMGGEKFITISQEAPTITQAIRIMKSKLDKELDFGHNKIILFGEEFVKKRNMVDEMDWLVRRRDIQGIAFLGIGRPDAETVLNYRPVFERLPGYALILPLSHAGTRSAYVTSEFLFDFAKRLKEKGMDPILPIIELDKPFYEINKAGVFDKRSLKLVLSPEDTKMLNFLIRDVASTDIKIQTKEYAFSIAADRVKSKISIQKKSGDSVVLGVKIDVTGIVEETTQTLSQEYIHQYERQAEKLLGDEIKDLLIKLQKKKLDPVGFGLLYRSRNLNNGDDWEQWQQLYPTAKFDIQVNVKIQGTGVIK